MIKCASHNSQVITQIITDNDYDSDNRNTILSTMSLFLKY